MVYNWCIHTYNIYIYIYVEFVPPHIKHPPVTMVDVGDEDTYLGPWKGAV